MMFLFQVPDVFFYQENIFMPYPTANLGFTGHIYKSIDTQTTLMILFLLACPVVQWK